MRYEYEDKCTHDKVKILLAPNALSRHSDIRNSSVEETTKAHYGGMQPMYMRRRSRTRMKLALSQSRGLAMAPFCTVTNTSNDAEKWTRSMDGTSDGAEAHRL